MPTYNLYECQDEGHLMVSPDQARHTGPCPYCGYRLCSRIGEATLRPGWDTENASSFTTFGWAADEAHADQLEAAYEAGYNNACDVRDRENAEQDAETALEQAAEREVQS